MRCPLLFAACTFVAGTLLACYLTIPSSFSASSAAICVLATIVFTLKKRRIISAVFALSGVLLLAILNISAREHHHCALEKLAETTPEQVQVTGRVCTDPQMVGPQQKSSERIWRFTVAVYDVSPSTNFRFDQKPLGNVLTYWRSESKDSVIHVGDTVQFYCNLYPLRRATNPGERGLWELSRSRGICARAYIKTKDEIVPRANGLSFSRAISAVRGRFRSVIERSFKRFSGKNSDPTPFLSAILVGDRSSLPQEKQSLYFQTGTFHILSISGLHVGVLAFLLFHFLRYLRVKEGPRALAIAVVIILYSFIGGLSIPLVRTTIIVLLYIGADVLLRQRSALNILSAAAIIMLLINPYDLFSVGFQLTFVGCLSLVLFAPRLDKLLDKLRPKRQQLLERLKDERPFGSGFARGWLSVSIAAWVGVQPLATYYFHIFTPLSIVINTIIVPVFLVLILSFGFCLVILGSIATICATAVSYPLWCLLTAFHWLLGWFTVPGMWFFLPNRFAPSFTLPALIAVYAALVLLALKFENVVRLKTVHVVTAFILAFTVYLGVGLVAAESKESEFTVLDVGNGSASVLREGGRTVLFDCGSTSRIRVGEEVIAPFLWNRGETTIDAVFLSHSDTDHVNGLNALIDRFRITCVLVSKYFESDEKGKEIVSSLEKSGIPVIRVGAGAEVEGIPGNIRVLAPVAGELFGKKLSANNSSLVVNAKSCGKSFLLCGDIEEDGIFSLLETNKKLSADILQLPHHGRKNLLRQKLRGVLNPQIVFVSRGWDEPSLFEEAADAEPPQTGALVFSTARSGSITFRVRNGEIIIEEFVKPEKSRNSPSPRE